MRIVTGYSDGQYYFREAEEDEVGIEVPDTTIEMWRAVFEAESVVQRQLRDLDDRLYETLERLEKQKEKR